MSFNYLYLPIGVPTFHLESAQIEFDKSVALLKSVDDSVIVPNEMLLSLDKLHEFIDDKRPDFVVVQNITFANGAYMTEILRTLDCPALLWTLKEPVIDGGRLRLNSLTGAFSAGNVLNNFGRPFEYVFGSPEEEAVKAKVAETLRAARLRAALGHLNILQIGQTPQGFDFGKAQEAEMATFGAKLLSVELEKFFDLAKSYTDDEVSEYLEDAKKRIVGLESIKAENVRDFAKLYKAYKEYVKQNNVGALSSRCWPDCFTNYGTPVCAVLAILNDLDVPASCEADTYGALSMFMGQFLTKRPTFFGDPVSMNAAENTVTFWHCGTAACSLAREDTGARAGVHCNRKIGPTLEFGCKAEPRVTIFRVGKNAEGKFRLFLATGEALDKPQQFLGTSIVVKTDGCAKGLVEKAVKNGWEPHFVVAMGDVANEMRVLANLLKIEVQEF
ncbi:MAG: fucose isomerase [Clostridia bacterium]|nr:fucose isomerase [Clostridia bacterium]